MFLQKGDWILDVIGAAARRFCRAWPAERRVPTASILDVVAIKGIGVPVGEKTQQRVFDPRRWGPLPDAPPAPAAPAGRNPAGTRVALPCPIDSPGRTR